MDGGRPPWEWGAVAGNRDEKLGIRSLLYMEVELGLTCLKIHAQCLSVFKNHLPFDLQILWLEDFIL